MFTYSTDFIFYFEGSLGIRSCGSSCSIAADSPRSIVSSTIIGSVILSSETATDPMSDNRVVLENAV
jgi:hypothetical protein